MKVTPPGSSAVDLGTTEASPTIGIVDYSRRETDAFGVTTVVRRDFSRRMLVKLAVPTARIDANMALFATLRAKAALWSADTRFAWLNVTGYYEDLSVDLPYGDLSYCTLTVAGLAEQETVADTGADPAANGRPSTLRFVEPVTTTDAVLVSSSLAEDDAAAWSSSATYDVGATVARGHRVYESLVAGNVGHDPAEAGGQWLDTGPTNLWAMFDQALGSATIASAPVEIVLKADAATSALALLDTNAATVRVRASSYDRTVVPDAAGKALFLDFAAAAGASVTVTITPAASNAAPRRWDDGAQWLDSGVWQDSLAAGDGTVTIGTFLFGAMKGLGTTEASPTAGITDYSVKQRDEFGEVTVVERAWAKNMAVKAQIASSAVDVVANRIAAVRATPALWIGDTVRDSLIVYGFFRDFSIEIGESVSKLSLSIEGLSKAAPIAPPSTGGSVAWPDITDPDGTKPTDNADVTGDNTSKDTASVGGRPAGDVVAAIDAARARQDYLDTVTIPAVNQAAAEADIRIAAAHGAADRAKSSADSALESIDRQVTRLDTRIDSVSASGGYDDTAVKAEVRRVDEAALGRDAALGRRVDSVTASITDTDTRFSAEIQRVETAAVDRDNAIGQRIDTIIAEGGGGSENVDSVARAEVSRVERASVTRDDALGTRVDGVSASIGPAINAKAQEITTAYTAADLALGSRQTLIEANATAPGGRMMNPNPAFYDLTGGDGTIGSVHATGWSYWFSPPDGSARLPGAVSPWAWALRANAGHVCGINGPRFAADPGWYVMDVTFELGDGTFSGAGIFLSLSNPDGTEIGFPRVSLNNLINDPDQSTPGTPFRLIRRTRLMKLEGAFRYIALIGALNWDGFGEPLSYKALNFHHIGLRPASDAEIKAQKADAALPAISARIRTAEETLADLPNRYAAASRTLTLEAQVAGTASSGLSDRIAGVDGRVTSVNTALTARIEERATAIADAKAGAVASTVTTLRSDYNGTVATVSAQAGTIVDLQRRSASFIRFIADAGGGRASFDLFADGYGGRWALTGDGLIAGNVVIDGNVVISGTISAGKFNSSTMSREGSSTWNGSITPGAGQTITVPWNITLPTVSPQGRFIYDYKVSVQTNAGTQQTSTHAGLPLYTNYIDDGGLFVGATDAQGNTYYPASGVFEAVRASTTFDATFVARISRGNYDTGIVRDGDYYYRNVSATYTVSSIFLHVAWIAI